MAKDEREPEMRLPRDAFSQRLRELSNHPEAVQRRSVIDIVDDYGNLTTWIATTFRHDGAMTLFLQRNTNQGGDRWLVPPQVVDSIIRQRTSAVAVNRRKGAKKGAATRKAEGTQFIPEPPKRPRRQARAGQVKRT